MRLAKTHLASKTLSFWSVDVFLNSTPMLRFWPISLFRAENGQVPRPLATRQQGPGPQDGKLGAAQKIERDPWSLLWCIHRQTGALLGDIIGAPTSIMKSGTFGLVSGLVFFAFIWAFWNLQSCFYLRGGPGPGGGEMGEKFPPPFLFKIVPRTRISLRFRPPGSLLGTPEPPKWPQNGLNGHFIGK